jgi:methionine salvage enolase-phosphatase E1
VLFVSDAAGELAAARSAGCVAVQCDRPGNRMAAEWEPTIKTFDELE